MGKIPIGTILDLSETRDRFSRRHFLKSLGIFGVGVTGITTAIEKAYGKETEGYPLVRTVDGHGNPESVRLVEKERYEMMQVYADPDLRKYFRNYPSVKQIRLEENNGNEYRFKFVLDNVTSQKTRRLPSHIFGTNVEYEGGYGEFKPDIGYRTEEATIQSVCGGRGDWTSVMKGGLAISPSNRGIYGTLGIVAYDHYGSEIIISADHVITDNDGNKANHITQGGRRVASYSTTSSGMDVFRYGIDGGISSNPNYVIGLGSVSSAWTYSGLYDAIREPPYEVPCEFSGATNCYNSSAVQDVARNRKVDYEAEMSGRNNDGGDSGGAWVDTSSTGRLVCFHQGSYSPLWSPYEYDVGGVAGEALAAIDATLLSS